MVSFDPSFRHLPADTDEGPALDHGIGQKLSRDLLDPPDLLALMAFKSPESSDVTLSYKEYSITLGGPSKMNEEEGPIFVAFFETVERVVGEVRIREQTGAFGKTGEISYDDVSGLVQAVKCRLLELALERTQYFVTRHIEPVVWSSHNEEALAKVGVAVSDLELVMYETGALHKSALQKQRSALMKVLVSDELTAALIVELGGAQSIITELTPRHPPDALLRCITDAFLVTQHGLSEQSPVTLHELLQNKTTLALIRPALQEHGRGQASSLWASALSGK